MTKQFRLVLKLLLCTLIVVQVARSQGSAISSADISTSQDFRPSFDVATIKVHPIGTPTDELGIDNLPDVVNGHYITLADLIEYAYGLNFAAQVSGIPDWARSLRFDVQARMSEVDIARMAQLTPKAQKTLRHQMMQSLLADRFHLTVHLETRQFPVYELVVAKNGTNLKGPVSESSPREPSGATLFGDHMVAHGFTMKDLADLLSDPSCGLGRPVIDDTALTAAYDFTLTWSPQMRNLIPGPDSTAPSPDEAVNVFSALRELGLKLQPSIGPMNTIVIDHVERPSPN